MITQELYNAKRLASARFLRRIPSVVGIGIGFKIVDNIETDIPCIRVYVNQRFESDDLSIRSIIPKEIMGQPTDVVEVRQHGFSPVSKIVVDAFGPNLNPKLAGAVGAVLVVGEEEYLLGANHVLSLNGRVPKAIINGPNGRIGETIPDGFVPLRHGQKNRVDGAIAKLDCRLAGTRDLQSKEDLAPPVLGVIVQKVGANNDRTGTIVDISADFIIDYSFGSFQMEDQIFVKVRGNDARFAKDGDSGSVIVDVDSQKVVGMVIASAGKFAAICPIRAILEGLSLQVPIVHAFLQGSASSRVSQRLASS